MAAGKLLTRNKSIKGKSGLGEIGEILETTTINTSLKTSKNILFNLVKNTIKNIDNIIVAGMTFYITKNIYSENCNS